MIERDYVLKYLQVILKNVSRTGMPIDEICDAVERSKLLDA